MGEYAKRLSDGASIKIGTCEEMYYIRFEDKCLVEPDENSGFGYWWRLPFPDEDNCKPGEYKQYNRNYPLGIDFKPSDEFRKETAENPGIIQFRNERGLLINVKCFHGEKLPEGNKDFQAHWNGFNCHYALQSIREDAGKLYPVVSCSECGHQWRGEWKTVLDAIHDKQFKIKLESYIQ